MNRKLLATLLHKNIEELGMITDSFIELNEYPTAIIHLAKRKTEDIQLILNQFSDIKTENYEIPSVNKTLISPETISENKPTTESTEKTSEKIIDEIKPAVNLNNEDTANEITIQPEEIPVSEAYEPVNTTEIIEEKTESVTVTESTEESIITVETTEQKEVTSVTDNHEVKVTTDETKKTTIADKIINPTVSRNETMSKADNSLSASIANKKISDIKQAISIGDRFRFQRELFKGNGEEMNKTLTYINLLATYEEAKSFLQTKYGWDEKNENTEDFLQIVKRKFL